MKERCFNHPAIDSVSFCHSCRRHFCADCLVVGGDYYFCKDNNCQAAIQSELDIKDKIKKDSKGQQMTTKAINLLNVLKAKGISPTLYFVIFGIGLALLILSISILKHVMDTSAAGLRSVVIDVSFSTNDIALIAKGLLLFVLGIFMIIKSFKLYNSAKNKKQEYSSSKLKRRTESLKKFNPQTQFNSLPKSIVKSKFKKPTGVMQFSHSNDVYRCFEVGGMNFTEGNMGSIDFITYDYEYIVEVDGPENILPDQTFRGTAILLQSDQLVLPSFKWGSAGTDVWRRVRPGRPPKAKEEAGSKQCPTCGSLDVCRGAMTYFGGYGGEFCPHCKKSLYKMSKEKAHKLMGLVLSIDNLRGWAVLASNTQLLLYRKSMVRAEKYQEFIEKALKIFQMFQSASQNLNEHA